MCLELFSLTSEIEIPFEDERIEFLSPDEMKGTYVALVKNVGDAPIDELRWLYPRPLFDTSDSPQIVGVEDKTIHLPDPDLLSYPSKETHGGLQFFVPDPNEPEKNIPDLIGSWEKNSTEHVLSTPLRDRLPVYNIRHLVLMNYHSFAAMSVLLGKSLPVGESRWFCWEIISKKAGLHVPKSLIGPHCFHQFASPVNVHRLVRETCLAVIDEFNPIEELDKPVEPQAPDPFQHLTVFEDFIECFGFRKRRSVDVQRHFLTLMTGDPNQLVLHDWQVQGDLRMLSGSPDKDAKTGFPIFKWKSGTKVNGESPRDEGFTLRLVLRY